VVVFIGGGKYSWIVRPFPRKISFSFLQITLGHFTMSTDVYKLSNSSVGVIFDHCGAQLTDSVLKANA